MTRMEEIKKRLDDYWWEIPSQIESDFAYLMRRVRNLEEALKLSVNFLETSGSYFPGGNDIIQKAISEDDE